MPQVVFCDMEKLPGEPGFERFFSSPGNMRQFVAFDVFLRYPVTDNYRYIGFTDTITEIGTDFNVGDGIFTVPVTGVYLFSVHVLPAKGKPLNIQIHRNGRPMATLSNGMSGEGMVGQVLVLDLVMGDQVRLYNYGGEIEGDEDINNTHFHFVGVLLYATER